MAGKKSKGQLKQERLVIVGAVSVVIVSVVTTLFLSNFFNDDRGASAGGYQNVTFTDAVLKCKQQVQADFGRKLQNFAMDDHSSRFDQASNEFKIFYIAQTKVKEGAAPTDFFVNCYVSAERGRISHFESFEKKESQTDAIRKEKGGIFGWPVD